MLQDYTYILDNKRDSKGHDKMMIGKKNHTKDETLNALQTVAPSMQNVKHSVTPKNLDNTPNY